MSLFFKVGGLEHKEVEGFACGHKAAGCHRQDLNIESLVPVYVALTSKLRGRQSRWTKDFMLQVLEPRDARGGGD